MVLAGGDKKNIDRIEKNRMKSCDFRLSDCCTYW